MANKFKVGQRVRLLANKEEGWPAERGVVTEDSGNGAYVVEVDEKYREDGDDGIRDGVPDFAMRSEATSRKTTRKTKKRKVKGKKRKTTRKTQRKKSRKSRRK